MHDGAVSIDDDVKSNTSIVSLFGICFAAVIADNVPAGNSDDDDGSDMINVDANLAGINDLDAKVFEDDVRIEDRARNIMEIMVTQTSCW